MRQIVLGGDDELGVQAFARMEEGFRVDSPSAMLEFFLQSSDQLHRYVARLTGGDRQLTEDVVQETFISLLRHGRDGADATMHISWLMTAARNRFIDQLRSRRREDARLERHAAGELRESPEPDFGTASSDQARWMLSRLPDQERLALALHTVDGLTIVEVAALIGRSVEATTSLLARARRRLRALMSEVDDDR